MGEKMFSVLRTILAVVAGYAVIVGGTTLVLTGLLGGVGYAEATLGEHAMGVLGTVVSGLLGGFVAAWIAGRRPLWHALGVALIVAVETTWILIAGVGSNPAWFNAAGGLTLMVTAVLGALAFASVSRPGAGWAGR